MELQMEPYEIVCKCEKGRMLRKLSNSVKNRNKMYYCCPKTKKTTKNGIWEWGCSYFLWEHELTRCPCGEGLCALVPREDKGMTLYRCSRQGCSPPGSEGGKASSKSITFESSGGFASGEGSSSRRCQRCPLLSIKSRILEAKLEIARSPEKHANTSSATVYEALDEIDDMLEVLLLNH